MNKPGKPAEGGARVSPPASITAPVMTLDPYAGVRRREALQAARNADFFPLPPALRAFPSELMIRAERDMRSVLAAWPRLTAFGLTDDPALDDDNPIRRRIEQRVGHRTPELFARERADMTTCDHLAALLAMQAWLRIDASPCGLPTNGGTGEPRMNMHTDLLARIADDELGHCPHGVAIAALVVEGYALEPAARDEYRIKPCWMWANVELSPDAWERERRRAEAREAVRKARSDAWFNEVMRGIERIEARRNEPPRARGPRKRGRAWSRRER
jgi:hypothetical protein